MVETLPERMRHAAAHVELYDQEWEAQQLRDGADEIDRLQAVVAAAEGLCFGEDWNNGTHAKIHRPRLIAALRALGHNNE